MASSDDNNNAFEALIHADRKRKNHEDLANTIFGRSKSSQNIKKPQNGNPKEARSPSLASRMGVQKRHSSSGASGQKNPFSPPSRPSSTTPSLRNAQAQSTRATRLANEIESGNANFNSSSRNPVPKPTRNGTQQSPSQPGPGISIKGSAGPFTVHASNFAPGTTEADIESALHSDLFDTEGNNCLLSCGLVTTRPAVVVEMVFSEKSVADRIIQKFNNLKADGRILKVEFIRSGTDNTNNSWRSTAANTAATPSTESAPVEDVNVSTTEGDMEMDEAGANAEYTATTSYDHDREAADRDRRDRDRDRDGFGTNPKKEERRDDRPREDRDRRRGDRDRDRDRDREDRGDRDRERERDRDRDREHGRERDRDYDRREPQPTQPYNNPEYSQRPPANAYGNGFNRPPRGGGGYGGYGGRGYGYPRGGGGYPPRGAYRGAYSR